ncbi:site-specific DNA-methyltransferase [Rhodococcus pyridinivorans]|uniref:site-specific DNA-methyltransferase n=1 Tax=Rhodococcus pyridinivorans TaxID=103816 RepID=UPI002226989A|nr:site-specific DNA-methyltransferase [Rhodococcus pyridinivorans]MCW3472283.1 site-specific DNA-methyltransferase [Rhodococcus pyridinivorans]
MTSPHLTAANIDKLAELFPNVVTETLDTEGNPKRAIDFDLLRQELSNHVVEGPQERYQLDWPGKRAAAFAANAPIAKTLRPVREESVDFDTTKNLFIEGDNLEALKLLQESYLGKVKLIYIDPPYNTGNDFVYNDDFAETADEYLLRSGQTDESGARLSANPESSGRFHSDWLSMMYPRLKLARNLMSDDGIIAISIDDNEVAALRIMGDEVFGSSAFIGALTWRRRPTPDSRNYSRVSVDHEYVLLYGRSNIARLKGRGIDESKYKNPDNDPRGPWTSENLTGLASADQRPNLHYELVNPATGLAYPPSPSRGWSKGRETMDRLIAEGRILWPTSPDGRPREKKFLSELKSAVTGFSTWLSSEEIGYNYTATREVRDLLGGKLFDFPKPVSLIKILCEQTTGDEDIVLDFFAGSGSTAHAVMSANAIDEATRRFILVQLGEPVEVGSEAAKAGYGSIAELARERVRRAGQAVVQQAGMDSGAIDLGFRTLKIDTTNMTDVTRTPDETDQLTLAELEGSVKPGRSSEDLLFQVLLDWGLELTMSITVEQINGNEVLVVEDGALIACFDSEVSLNLVRLIAKREPLRAVFRDSGFASDDARINAEQVFRELSPATDVKAI